MEWKRKKFFALWKSKNICFLEIQRLASFSRNNIIILMICVSTILQQNPDVSSLLQKTEYICNTFLLLKLSFCISEQDTFVKAMRVDN